MKRHAAAAILAAGIVALAAPAHTAPQPSEVPLSWVLEIDYETPRLIQVLLPGEFKPKTFWYMRYTVINRTGGDRVFVPEFVLYTDTGQVRRAGRKAPTMVFDAVQKLYNDPLLRDVTAMTGVLLQGEDNAKEGVAIWQDIDPVAGTFDVFIGGLSGETVRIKLPVAVKVEKMDAEGNLHMVEKDEMVLSRTLQLRFAIPGEASGRSTAPIKLIKENWVMR